MTTTPHDSPAPTASPPPGRAPAAPGPARTTRPRITAPLCLLAFAALYLVAVCTPFGQRGENHLLGGEDGATPAWIYDLSGAAYGSAAMPPLERTVMPTLVVGLVVIAAVALVRRRWWQGCAAVGAVVAAVGTKELAARVLPRPGLVNAEEALVEASFPSGHAIVPAALVLGLLLVVSPRVRPYVAAIGTVWFTVTAAAVQATYHHRPSDVLGSALLACGWYVLATRLLPPAAAPEAMRSPRALPPVALASAAAGALLAGARDDSLVESLAFAAAAFLCALLFWSTAAQGSARPARRP